MVKINKKNEILLKIVIYGPATSGKTTYLDTLHRLSREGKIDLISDDKLIKMAMTGGETLYFDRGIFKFRNEERIQLQTFTVAGQTRFGPLRKKVLMGTDALIFFVDSQRSRLDANINSFKELRRSSKEYEFENIPLLVVLNKNDLEDVVGLNEWEVIMEDEGFLTKERSPFLIDKPIGFETISIYENRVKVYESFIELIKRLKNTIASELGL